MKTPVRIVCAAVAITGIATAAVILYVIDAIVREAQRQENG